MIALRVPSRRRIFGASVVTGVHPGLSPGPCLRFVSRVGFIQHCPLTSSSPRFHGILLTSYSCTHARTLSHDPRQKGDNKKEDVFHRDSNPRSSKLYARLSCFTSNRSFYVIPSTISLLLIDDACLLCQRKNKISPAGN